MFAHTPKSTNLNLYVILDREENKKTLELKVVLKNASFTEKRVKFTEKMCKFKKSEVFMKPLYASIP